MPKIKLITPDGTKLEFELTIDRATVGRAEGNDIVVPDGSVSSRHGEILVKGKDIELVDLGSLNGTHIGGERVERGVVVPGGKFKLGMVEGILVGDDITPKSDREESPEPKEERAPQATWSAEPATAAVIVGLGATPCPVRQRKGFGPRVKEKDKIAGLFIMIGVISLLVCAAAMFLIYKMGS